MVNSSPLDWSRVQAFLAVADTGSLSAAARQLGQSQPTIGRHIHALENVLRVTLFHRHRKGMSLTEAGAALLSSAEEMQDAAKRLSLVAAGEVEDLSGTIRVTASVFFSHHVLPPIFAALRAEIPEVQVELVASDSTENLTFREADIAIRMYEPKQLDVVTRHIGDAPLAFFAAKTYLDRCGRPQTVEDVKDHDVVGYDTSELIINGMRDRGLQVTRDWFVVRCDHQTVYWELVRAGCGIGFGQTIVGKREPLVEQLNLGVDLPRLPVWLTTHEKLHRTPRVRRVWTHLVSHLRPYLDAP